MNHRIIILLLIAVVGCAPALFAVPAAAMTMAAVAGGGGEPEPCAGCPEAGSDAGVCAAICFSANHAAALADRDVSTVDSRADHHRANETALPGRVPLPEPGPPRLDPLH